jgi:hypothetical protein
MKHLKLLFAAALMASCDMGTDGNGAVRDTAEAWAEAYFNCDYVEAGKYATAESDKWLRFAASNTTEQELELVNGRHAVVASDDDVSISNDTLRTVTLRVNNYLKPSMLGEPAVQPDEEGVFYVSVVKRDGRWQVRMEGLPQSEKQSRD